MIKPEEPEDRDPVWGLLARARKSDVDSQFSRKVVRAVRAEVREGNRFPWVGVLFTPPWRFVIAAAVAVAIVEFIVVPHQWRDDPSMAGARTTATVSSRTEAADELGDQLASELAMLDEIDGLLDASDAGELIDTHLDWLLF